MNAIIISEKSAVVKGTDVIKSVFHGEVVKVIKHEGYSNTGDILMRTTSNIHPFITLSDGSLWGCSLDGYTFERITGEVKIELE